METWSCNCVGPRNGEPVCPCQMRNVKIIDGRYVQVNDLGPVPSIDAVEIAKEALKNYRENKMFRQGIDRKAP